ncbi:MAG: clan AA aspartic protease [Candidatus Bathyarchaeota archaeon]|nr:MAG: clan AA aspartic protease [Candidatus Bathyarchaeota archaeon]
MTKFYIANPERPIITIKGTINQIGPFNFIFDTGSSMTVIEKQTAEKLGLSDKTLATRNALGAGGALVATTRTVESIKVDDVEAKDIQVGIMDLSNVSKCGCIGDLGGIIGYNFVKDYRVLIDYPKQEIFFKKD